MVVEYDDTRCPGCLNFAGMYTGVWKGWKLDQVKGVYTMGCCGLTLSVKELEEIEYSYSGPIAEGIWHYLYRRQHPEEFFTRTEELLAETKLGRHIATHSSNKSGRTARRTSHL